MSEDSAIPRHVGLILDGNRRWAKSRGLPTLEGHRLGADNLWTISKKFLDEGVEVVTAFVFSTENWNRTEKEVSYLMKLIIDVLKKYIDKANENNIRIMILGSRERLSEKVLEAITHAEHETLNNTKGTLALCLNYGGRQEIIDAVKFIIDGSISSDCINEKDFEQYLYGDNTLGDIDLVVRTSGEQRLSGFMTWRTTYSELLFLQKHWPEVTESDVLDIIEEFKHRQRRFGS